MFVRDGENLIGGLFDIGVILHDVRTRRYHPAFAIEMPMPGPMMTRNGLVRLRSQSHHTEGCATLEEARRLMTKFRERITLPDSNISLRPIDWNGAPFVILARDWHHDGGHLDEVLSHVVLT